MTDAGNATPLFDAGPLSVFCQGSVITWTLFGATLTVEIVFAPWVTVTAAAIAVVLATATAKWNCVATRLAVTVG